MFHFSDLTVFIILPGLAGLMILSGVGIVTLVGRALTGSHGRFWGTQVDEGDEARRIRTSRLQYGLLALAFWFALTVFLILDLTIASSVHLGFSAAYAAFWALVGVLILSGSPGRLRLVIVALFIAAVLSVRFMNWNSRKPFLRDFYRIEEGMTPAQVREIMGDYMGGNFGGPAGSHDDYVHDEQGELVAGSVTYRHTDEGWGNSDWGVVTFEDGRVVQTRFFPD